MTEQKLVEDNKILIKIWQEPASQSRLEHNTRADMFKNGIDTSAGDLGTRWFKLAQTINGSNWKTYIKEARKGVDYNIDGKYISADDKSVDKQYHWTGFKNRTYPINAKEAKHFLIYTGNALLYHAVHAYL